MSNETGKWLEKAVALEIKRNDIKRVTLAEVEKPNFLGGESSQ